MLATGLRFSFPRHDVPSQHDSPLFERMGTDEYAQLQDCRQIIDSLQQRVHDLERINLDLEYRLEDQAKQCMEVEKECVSIERSWKAKCEALEKEIADWKQQYEAQKLKGDRVREHLSRTERELYGILQRKYELMRGPGGRPTGGPGSSSTGGGSGGGGGGGSGGGNGGVGTPSTSTPSLRQRGSGSGGDGSSSGPFGFGSVDELNSLQGRSSRHSGIRQNKVWASIADFFGW